MAPEDLDSLRRARRWEDLSRALEQAIEAAPDQRIRLDRLQERARLMEEQMMNREGAARDYNRMLEIDPGNTAALTSLARICEMTADWAALVGLLERQADLAADTAEHTAILVRCARIYWSQLDDFAKANDLCQQALSLDPDDAGARALADELLDK
jgi:tetratricopeptide (TPR) repeat protein